jgi:Tfp pilus assembly protein PilF
MPMLPDNLEKLLAQGTDSAPLRFALGSQYLTRGEAEVAATHLRVAVDLDPDYSAAWKLLGKALTLAGEREEALASYRRGIEVAQRCGDMQALREMKVFAARLQAQKQE